MKVIFLDIDGVMNRFNPEQHEEIIEDDLVMNLKELVDETGAFIVISSTWKVSDRLTGIIEDKLNEIIGFGAMIGCTPNLFPQDKREKEIQMWLDHHHGEVESYVILDDYDFELQSFIKRRRCVITDALFGLTKEDCQKAAVILRKRL